MHQQEIHHHLRNQQGVSEEPGTVRFVWLYKRHMKVSYNAVGNQISQLLFPPKPIRHGFARAWAWWDPSWSLNPSSGSFYLTACWLRTQSRSMTNQGLHTTPGSGPGCAFLLRVMHMAQHMLHCVCVTVCVWLCVCVCQRVQGQSSACEFLPALM